MLARRVVWSLRWLKRWWAGAPSARLRVRPSATPRYEPDSPTFQEPIVPPAPWMALSAAPCRYTSAERFPPDFLALAGPRRAWGVVSSIWPLPPIGAPSAPRRVETRDFRRGYPEVWALESCLARVARPFVLRTRIRRLGAEGVLPPAQGRP